MIWTLHMVVAPANDEGGDVRPNVSAFHKSAAELSFLSAQPQILQELPLVMDWFKESSDRRDFCCNMITNHLGSRNHASFICVRRIM